MLTRTPPPSFANPPVVETIIGVQFATLTGFRSHHYGWLWREFLGADEWIPIADEKPLPEYMEPFDSPLLKTTAAQPETSLRVRLKLRSKQHPHRTLQIQADKFYLSWVRGEGALPDYGMIKPLFDEYFTRFEKFVSESLLGQLKPNLWEVMYVNIVRKGKLWSEPNDWHRVLPTFFPSGGPASDGLKFTTYDGNWHFEIEPKLGRVHVRIAKMVVNQDPEPVLFIQSIARGQIDESLTWSDGIDLGHRACIYLFCDITSTEAHEEWGRLS